MVGVIFVWTPAHFWALATLAYDENRTAGIRTVPGAAGTRHTIDSMLACAGGAVAANVVPVVTGRLGPVYLAIALAAGGWVHSACDCSFLAATRDFRVR